MRKLWRALALLAVAGARMAAAATQANIAEFPFMVSLQRASTAEHHCGGTLVGLAWVLTTASCLHEKHVQVFGGTWSQGGAALKARHYRVVAGTPDATLPVFRSGYTTGTDAQIRMVRDFYVHPSYNADFGDNNVGLVKLWTPFETTDTVQVASLARAATCHDNCTVVSWGSAYASSPDKTDRDESVFLPRSGVPGSQLRTAELPLITLQQCRNVYGTLLVHNSSICTLHENATDACGVDIGGTLVCGRDVLGIASWGVGCRNKLPGVYVNVSGYDAWVGGLMRRNGARGAASSWLLVTLACCCTLLRV